jgi:tRNA U55 pseudouridine synthase TruB
LRVTFDPPSDKAVPINPETTRIVLRLDDAISAFRAGQVTGIPALDSAGCLAGDQASDLARSGGGFVRAWQAALRGRG